MRKEDIERLLENWGQVDGQRVIDLCSSSTPFNDTLKVFLGHCTACGGDWGGMLLSGIQKLFPDVYDAIPDDMGPNVFACLMSVLALLGVNFG